MGSETLSSTGYIFSDESSIAFYSTSNGYTKLFGFRHVTSSLLQNWRVLTNWNIHTHNISKAKHIQTYIQSWKSIVLFAYNTNSHTWSKMLVLRLIN